MFSFFILTRLHASCMYNIRLYPSRAQLDSWSIYPLYLYTIHLLYYSKAGYWSLLYGSPCLMFDCYWLIEGKERIKPYKTNIHSNQNKRSFHDCIILHHRIIIHLSHQRLLIGLWSIQPDVPVWNVHVCILHVKWSTKHGRLMEVKHGGCGDSIVILC